jgi:hypothetical protein
MKTVEQACKEYMDLMDSPPNGLGQHVHEKYGESHKMLRFIFGKFGEEAVCAELGWPFERSEL